GGPSHGPGSSVRPSSPTGPPTESAPSKPSGERKQRKRRPSPARRTARLFRFDRGHGTRFVAGTDEAGRGSLAGPPVAAGVLLDYDALERKRARRALAGLDDSKQKSPEEREALYPRVLEQAARVTVTVRCPTGID